MSITYMKFGLISIVFTWRNFHKLLSTYYSKNYLGSLLTIIKTTMQQRGISLQQNNEDKDMLLMLDYGIYYEFIKKEDWHNDQPNTISLVDVELNEPYEMG